MITYENDDYLYSGIANTKEPWFNRKLGALSCEARRVEARTPKGWGFEAWAVSPSPPAKAWRVLQAPQWGLGQNPSREEFWCYLNIILYRKPVVYRPIIFLPYFCVGPSGSQGRGPGLLNGLNPHYSLRHHCVFTTADAELHVSSKMKSTSISGMQDHPRKPPQSCCCLTAIEATLQQCEGTPGLTDDDDNVITQLKTRIHCNPKYIHYTSADLQKILTGLIQRSMTEAPQMPK